ncbi:MAG TPA: hypothetical protein VGL59_21840 [Polyangia bacterium]|jgi:hypothetical protein
MSAQARLRIAMTVALAAVGAGCAAGGSSNAGGNPASGSGGFSGAGSGGSSAGNGGNSGSGTGGTTTGGSGGASADAASDGGGNVDAGAMDGAAGCYLNMDPAPPLSFQDKIERSPTPFRVRAQAIPSLVTDQWSWTVVYPDSSFMHPPAVNNDPTVIEFPLSMNGSYVITAQVNNRSLCTPISRSITVIDPLPTEFAFRVFPPAALTLPVQEFRLTRQKVTDGLLLDAQVQQVQIFAYDDVQQVLPTYLQITSPGSTLVIEGNTQRGLVNVPLLLQREYDLLLIPSRAFAPKLLIGTTATLASAVKSLSFDPGITVSGQAQRDDGSPVVGARLVLRDGARPSTVGISDGGGAFSLLTRDGAVSVEIDAPDGSGLPDAQVSAAAGIVLGSAASALTLTMRWAALPAGALKLTIHNSDGTTAASGAAVHAELTAPIAAAGVLTVHSPDAPAGSADLTLTASGSMRADAVADGNGAVTFGALPAGAYRLTVTPAAGAAADAAITMASVAVGAAGATSDVRIARKIILSGTLQTESGGSSQGMRLSAIDTGADVVTTPSSAVLDSSGHYALTVDPGRNYKLWAVPAAGQLLARTVVATLTAPAANQTLGAFIVPTGVRTDSSVRISGPVGDALVQVFCPPASTTCVETTLPIAEAITAMDGTFNVVLPDTGATAAGSGKI